MCMQQLREYTVDILDDIVDYEHVVLRASSQYNFQITAEAHRHDSQYKGGFVHKRR